MFIRINIDLIQQAMQLDSTDFYEKFEDLIIDAECDEGINCEQHFEIS
jgi:hypothetical protein